MANHPMNPSISVITLGVNDLEKSLAFYRDGLGLQTTGIIGTEFKGDETHPSGAVVMFELQHGVILALYPRTELAKDAKEHLQERGTAEKNQWLKGILAEGKIPEIRILEEVPLRPRYLWQERERWWIAHLHKKGAQLTNRMYRNETVPKKALIRFRPPHTHWKYHRQPNAACVNKLSTYLTAGRTDLFHGLSIDDEALKYDKSVGNILCCERYPTGTVCVFTGGLDPVLDSLDLQLFITWFCKCTITVQQTLLLGMFPVLRDYEERKTFVYPIEPGIYQTHLWKEQVQDCLDAGCAVTVHNGWAWEAWTEDNKAWIALCQELQEYAPRLEATDNPAMNFCNASLLAEPWDVFWGNLIPVPSFSLTKRKSIFLAPSIPTLRISSQ